MKQLYFIFMFSFCFYSYSQNPMIFENNWALHKIVIEGVDFLPPSNWEVASIPLSIVEGESGEGIFTTNVCNYGGGNLSFVGASNFNFDVFIVSLMMCNLNENNDFENLYFYQFFQQNFTEPFSYTVTQDGNLKTLVVTNDEGWQAFYFHQDLSIQMHDRFAKILIYPNPAKDHISISLPIAFRGEAEIYNTTGQIVYATNFNSATQIKILLPNLADGIYYLKLYDNNYTYHAKFLIN